MISHSHRCIFVHIPKTAGNSVNRAFGVDWQDHKDLARYACELGAEELARYYKFAIVRNPWERIFSDYNYQKKKSRPKDSKLFLFSENGERRQFAEWVKAVLENPHRYDPASWGGDISAGLHRWSPQFDWISLGGRIAVDTVLRIERLPEDFRQVCMAVGLSPVTLPHRNSRSHRHYSWYYDLPTRERVEAYYAKDIATFGYRFEPSPARRAVEYSRSLASSLLFPIPQIGAPSQVAGLSVSSTAQEGAL